MPRTSNQKLRPIYLARILLEHTDDNNVFTAQGIIDALSAYDIPATRKVVYEDVEALRQYGLDIRVSHILYTYTDGGSAEGGGRRKCGRRNARNCENCKKVVVTG
jgi:hypothetical protein